MRRGGRIAARALAVVAALLVAGWFAVQARDAHELAQARALLAGPQLPTLGQIHQVRHLLGRAKLLEPGQDVELVRAQLAFEEGRRAKAAGILHGVLAAEPMNLPAWVLLAEANPNRTVLDLALRHIAQLDPLR